MSIHRYKDKEDVVHIYSGILRAIKKERSNAFAANMDATRDHHTKQKVRQKKDKYDITLRK